MQRLAGDGVGLVRLEVCEDRVALVRLAALGLDWSQR